jgi:hypothetical protein
MLTIAYARVSTEHQTDHSPEAQRRRAIAYAKSKDIGPVRTISDEGRSGKNLERPGIQELIALVEADLVAHVIVWRIDRLSRNTGHISRLLDLFDKHSVGFHRRKDEWFPGRHQPLITQDEFDAAQRAHVPGRRRGSDLLSGRVRCGQCGRIAAIDSNGRNQPLYRCRHRGQSCNNTPGRSAAGLHRAARLGLNLLRTDDHLLEAIRAQLAPEARGAGGGSAEPSRAGALASLRRKRDKLMGLYLDDKITDDYFAEQERSLTAKIEAIEKDHSVVMTERKNKTILADAFEQAATLIRSPEFTLDAVWDNASQAERRVLVEELIEAVMIHADRLEVTVAGAPPLIVRPGEVGLRDPGTGPVVSKMGLEPTRPLMGH